MWCLLPPPSTSRPQDSLLLSKGQKSQLKSVKCCLTHTLSDPIAVALWPQARIFYLHILDQQVSTSWNNKHKSEKFWLHMLQLRVWMSQELQMDSGKIGSISHYML